MRLSSPTAVTDDSSQVSSVCSCTSPWRKSTLRSRVQARGQQQREQVVEPGAQLGGVVGHG